jgi:hypothetical protein
MRLILRGDTTTLSKSEARFATQWAVRELVGKRLSQNIGCYMEFKELKDDHGSCLPLAYLESSRAKARRFKIEINNTTRRSNQLLTIFHECKHLDQMAHEDLIWGEKDEYVHCWRRRTIIDEREYSYCDLPWEIEAFKAERMLYDRYMQHKAENRITFD